jgi:hypothetical protein
VAAKTNVTTWIGRDLACGDGITFQRRARYPNASRRLERLMRRVAIAREAPPAQVVRFREERVLEDAGSSPPMIEGGGIGRSSNWSS